MTEPSDAAAPHRSLTAEERDLGMGRDVTRRDFINTLAVGTGAALLDAAAPGFARTEAGSASARAASTLHPWTGYGGVGDYARCNGETWDVVHAAHGIRDHRFEGLGASAQSTGETHDVVIVGGGFAGVVAACTFLKATNRQRTCLMLDNHPIIGGEAKRNEFLVRGQRLMGPQGSNGGGVPTSGVMGDIWKQLGLPSQFERATLSAERRSMEFPGDNYMYLLWGDNFENHGYFFDTPRPHWVTNPWGRNLENTPWPEDLRREFLRWRDEPLQPFDGDETALQRWLDSMTYDEYLTKYRKLHPDVGRWVDPIVASGIGLGADVLSANAPYYFSYPGFQGLSRAPRVGLASDNPGHKLTGRRGFAFPGGNDARMRVLVKWLNPEVIDGSTFADIHNGAIRFEAMDRANAPCRMRAGATVVSVAHDPEARPGSEPATITYVKGGKLYSVRARTVIWAGACWSGKHAIQHLPTDYRTAMESFSRAPILVVNVALDNWRFLYKLGYSACSWRGGFGYTANMVAPVPIGDFGSRFDPDWPVVWTFYVPYNERGRSLVEQGKAARKKMFATSYREYEKQIRQQMVKLFGSAGFDSERDIAGIVLNRWGHAYVTAGPGFFFGRDGKPAPSDVLRRPLGRLTFAHSELSGHQNAGAAALEGTRAAEQVLGMLQ